MLLTRLGVPWLWGADIERAWSFMRYWVAPTTLALAPGSYGYGLERVPRSGGAVLASNHLSAIDPPLVGSFCPRAICWMMKAELLELPVVGEALTWTGAFPVHRGEPDRAALRKAQELVRDGHVVGIFVEGTRQRFGYPGAVHPGAVMVALREHVPVIPCGLDSFGWELAHPRPCAVVFGEPLHFDGLGPGVRGAKEATEHLQAELLGVWRLAAQAAVDGFPYTLPDGSRRSAWVKPGEEIRVRAPRRVSGIA